MTVKITAILARGESGAEVCFELCGGDGQIELKKLLISAAQLANLRLSVGEANEEIFDAVEREARLYEAVRRAARSLEYGSCSKKTLCIKLRRAGFDTEISAEAVEFLAARGLLDDYSNACREAEKCEKKLWGRKRIEAELLKKGYGGDSVRGALDYLDGVGVDYVANCKRLVGQKLRHGTSDAETLKKLYPSLIRYGYSPSEIKSALSYFLSKRK